jgi:hypothetical protein
MEAQRAAQSVAPKQQTVQSPFVGMGPKTFDYNDKKQNWSPGRQQGAQDIENYFATSDPKFDPRESRTGNQGDLSFAADIALDTGQGVNEYLYNQGYGRQGMPRYPEYSGR